MVAVPVASSPSLACETLQCRVRGVFECTHVLTCSAATRGQPTHGEQGRTVVEVRHDAAVSLASPRQLGVLLTQSLHPLLERLHLGTELLADGAAAGLLHPLGDQRERLQYATVILGHAAPGRGPGPARCGD